MSKYHIARWKSAEVRSQKSRPKDLITLKVLESLKVGKDFSAILMPCLHGIELEQLEVSGASARRLFAIERVAGVWSEMKRQGRVRVTPKPMDAQVAIDFIQAEHPEGFNFIYGDFLGYPDFTHLEFLVKVFALKMVKPGGTMLLTFGRNRCRKIVSQWNAILRRIDGRRTVPTPSYVDMALEITGHRKYRNLIEHPYKSRNGSRTLTYVATEVRFP